MKNIMVTNNVRCLEKWEGKLKVDYKEEWSYLDVLLAARDYIHRGYFLLTHPLAGSVKPNQTPFKSIILSEESLVPQIYIRRACRSTGSGGAGGLRPAGR